MKFSDKPPENMNGNLIRLFFILFTVTSCSTARVNIEVLRPPLNEVKSDVEEVALINRADTQYAKSSLYVQGEYVKDLNGLNTGMQEAALYGLGIALNDFGYYNAGEGKGGNYKFDGRFNGPKLSQTEVKRLCALYKVDGIIALEGYEARIDASGEVTSSVAVDRSYGTVYVPLFNGRQDVNMRLFFRFYDNLSKTVVYEEEIEDDASAISSGSTPEEVEKGMPDRAGIMERLAIKLGNKAARHMSPYWEEEVRTFYVYGSNDLVRAGNLALKGYWEDASNIWYELTESPAHTGTIKKACYNMILASEVAGDLDLAVAWAERCIEDYGMKRAEKYKQLLEKRKGELEDYLD